MSRELEVTQDVLIAGEEALLGLKGHSFDIITIEKPRSLDLALSLTRIVSKLSPFVGNLIEKEVCSYLNSLTIFQRKGLWRQQDPDFPDTVFDSHIKPIPGFEIKAWFPLATEITARFKESQAYLSNNNIDLVLLAWLPKYLFYGKPTLIDVVCVPANEIAKTRDLHYHNPPDYLVLEPEDTSSRTRNLQQYCVNGYKFQGSEEDLVSARRELETMRNQDTGYSIKLNYQNSMRRLFNGYRYRLDTNFAKIDRINNSHVEAFKKIVLDTEINGKSIQEWSRLISEPSNEELIATLAQILETHQ